MRLLQHLKGETEVKTAHHRYQIWDNAGKSPAPFYVYVIVSSQMIGCMLQMFSYHHHPQARF